MLGLDIVARIGLIAKIKKNIQTSNTCTQQEKHYDDITCIVFFPYIYIRNGLTERIST